MIPSHQKHASCPVAWCVLFVLSLACASPRITSQESASASSLSTSMADTRPPQHTVVPVGTILPVVLRTTISPAVAKPNQTIHGQIAQDVPLPGSSRIRKGSRIEGEIVEVATGPTGSAEKISIRFNKLHMDGQVIPITTSLRAMAGFMEVLDAGTPTGSVGESDVFDWMTTRQIGGDSVYGRGGVVTSGQSGQVIGSAPISGGVLVQVSANPSGHCRGGIEGNENPQALWVFSSDACGTYGLSNVHILHAGRSEPAGTFTLGIGNGKTKIRNGDGLLLRVIG